MPAHEFSTRRSHRVSVRALWFLPLELAALVFFILKVAACVHCLQPWRVTWTVGRHRNLLLLAPRWWAHVVEEFRWECAFFCVALMVLAHDAAESGRVMTSAVARGAIATKLTPIAPGFCAAAPVGSSCLATRSPAALALLPAVVVGIDANARPLKILPCAMQKTTKRITTAAVCSQDISRRPGATPIT
jgi:hypothetical protein